MTQPGLEVDWVETIRNASETPIFVISPGYESPEPEDGLDT